jgi:ABC-type phosphate/phosphonate transport system substrate-binding protein
VVEVDGEIETQTQIVAEAGEVFTIPNVWQRSFCRVDAGSASGWIVPMLALKANSVDPFSGLGTVVDVADDDAVLESILDGDCEVGVTEIGAEQAFGDEEAFDVLAELPPVPNTSVVVSAQLDGPRDALMSDLLRKNLGEIAALIGADDLIDVAQVDYSELNALLDLAGVDVAAMAE